MASLKPVQINSYIILDLETTGLPSIQFKTKITELSILCLDRFHVLHTHENCREMFMPRVVNKLNLCMYPKKLINVKSSEVTGLTNDFLQDCSPFNNDVFDILHNLINIMKPPTCILAHNGYKFDFPILRSEIEHIGKALSDDIYCADTLLAFRELVPKKEVKEKEILEKFDYDIISEFDRTIDISDDENVIPGENIVDGVKIDWGNDSLDVVLNLAAEEAERKYLQEVKSINLEHTRMNNETTPKSKKPRFLPNKNKSVNSDTKSIAKKLFHGNQLTVPKSYRLCDMYHHLTRKEIVNAHQADSDTHALLECIVALGPPLLQWIDCNCKPFNGIKKLW